MIRHALLSMLLCLSGAQAASQRQWHRSRRSLLTNFNNMYNPCVVETGGEYGYSRVESHGCKQNVFNSFSRLVEIQAFLTER